jgi:general secretion pathway protein E
MMVEQLSADPSGLGTLLALLPRGDGFFYHHGKLIAVLLLYFGWLATLVWADRDALMAGMPREKWNLLFLGCFALGLLCLWLIPSFAFAFLLLLVFFLSPLFIYVAQRNQKVPPQLRVLTPEHIQRFLRKGFGGSGRQVVEKAKPVPIRFIGKSFNQTTEDRSRVTRAAESPGYRAAEELVFDALKARATDIHLEPTKEEMTVRYRVDSILQAVPSFSRSRGDTVLNVYKVLAGLDIFEKRKPQDGSFQAEIEGERTIDFRVATAGSVNGEKLVMRILDTGQQMTTLTTLGLRDAMREKLEPIIQQSYGMLITCGPTGAGKTSTLYACLHEIDRYARNVITLENPVEYQIDNVTQIEINPKAGKTFATELRSILRQDPDVILVGEIRDAETAEIACQAAQTGHMVFSTLHANDALTAIGRLVDLGVKPFMVASALSALLAQRLVRLLCPECKVSYKPPIELLQKLKLNPDRVRYFYRPPKEGERSFEESAEGGLVEKKCENCLGTGYIGRTGLFEMLLVDDEIKNLIRSNLDLTEIKKTWIKQGFGSLLQDGLRKVLEGKTSYEEIVRVAK